MKLKTISWKLRDPKEVYADFPQINPKVLFKVTCPQDLFNQFRFLFDNETVEKFVVFWLSSSNKVTGFEIISVGSINASVVSPREVFRGAVINNCVNIIVAHNHPSGNPVPSKEDISLTTQLIEGGKLISISIFDHIIFCNDEYYSFTENRLI